MTSLTGWLCLAAKLYPKPWRARYAEEFDAMLAGMDPQPADLFDVLQGATAMHLNILSTHLKLVGAVALTGVIVSLSAAYLSPRTYVSTSTVKAPGSPDADHRIAYAWSEVVSRGSLSEIIQRPRLDLYKGQRRRKPLEDVIEGMQRDILFHRLDDGNIRISFLYPDPYKAKDVTDALAYKLLLAANKTPRDVGVERMTSANLPETPLAPNLVAFLFWGLTLGLVAGTLVAFLRSRARPTLKVLAVGLVGFIAAGALSLLIPNHYISSSRVGVTPLPNADGTQRYMTDAQMSAWLLKKQFEVFNDTELSEIIQRPHIDLYHEQRQKMPIEAVIAMMRKDLVIRDTTSSMVIIAFNYTDRFKAQQVVSALVTKLVESNFQGAPNATGASPKFPVFFGPQKSAAEPCVGKTGDAYVDCVARQLKTAATFTPPVTRMAIDTIDLLDPASLPETPVAPNRWQIAMLGLLAGLLLGAWLLRDRRRPPSLTPATAH